MPNVDTQHLIIQITRLQAQRRILPNFGARLLRQVDRLAPDGYADHAELLRALHVIATDGAYSWPNWAEFWAVAGEAIANGLITGYPNEHAKHKQKR